MKKIKRRGWKNSPKPLHFTSPHNSYLARARKEKKKLPTLSSQNPLPEDQTKYYIVIYNICAYIYSSSLPSSYQNSLVFHSFGLCRVLNAQKVSKPPRECHLSIFACESRMVYRKRERVRVEMHSITV
ncbi:hypothetical protein HKD37_19G053401 [Glycine soja]|uniref:Uncharacterized protein n=2 Tax=Glycine subgen. Soja TaxID=1462606 RepID=A0A0R0EVI5_SOYBN|nr:hypothetical protein GmHk_19G054575 [Glycine max]RZB46924.1 hypothetical protein D0Y65_050807 [Glycine soja]